MNLNLHILTVVLNSILYMDAMWIPTMWEQATSIGTKSRWHLTADGFLVPNWGWQLLGVKSLMVDESYLSTRHYPKQVGCGRRESYNSRIAITDSSFQSILSTSNYKWYEGCTNNCFLWKCNLENEKDLAVLHPTWNYYNSNSTKTSYARDFLKTIKKHEQSPT